MPLTVQAERSVGAAAGQSLGFQQAQARPTQSHALSPYVQAPSPLSHMPPTAGCAAGQNWRPQSQPVDSHSHSSSPFAATWPDWPYSQAIPTVVQAACSVGMVLGQSAGLQHAQVLFPSTQSQTRVPNEQVPRMFMQVEPAAGSLAGHAVCCGLPGPLLSHSHRVGSTGEARPQLQSLAA
jgi:hypothetical protein